MKSSFPLILFILALLSCSFGFLFLLLFSDVREVGYFSETQLKFYFENVKTFAFADCK